MAKTTQTFEEKVRSMSGKEIVMAMVDGLKNPAVAVDMGFYGKIKDGVCFGCAATNTVCKISGVAFTTKNILRRYEAIDTDGVFLAAFEEAINSLRCGNIEVYNAMAEEYGFATLKEPVGQLPYLSTVGFLRSLPAYEAYANTL